MKDEFELPYPFTMLQQKCIAFDEAVRSGNEDLALLMIKEGFDWKMQKRIMLIVSGCGQLKILKFLLDYDELTEDDIREVQITASADGQLMVLKILTSEMSNPMVYLPEKY